MTLRKILTLLVAPVMLVSCGPTASEGCAGWRPIRVADATVDLLAAHDAPALEALIAHHEFGQAQGCWR